MKIKHTFIKIIIIGSALILLSNCKNNRNSIRGTGYYIDSAVKGVNYQCGSIMGITNYNGEFTFEKGKGCIFVIIQHPN